MGEAKRKKDAGIYYGQPGWKPPKVEQAEEQEAPQPNFRDVCAECYRGAVRAIEAAERAVQEKARVCESERALEHLMGRAA